MDRCSFISPMARVISGLRGLDIFPYVVNRTSGRIYDVEMKKYYNISHFFPFQKCVFTGVKTWCPRKIRDVLESTYADLRPEYICENGQWVIRKADKSGNIVFTGLRHWIVNIFVSTLKLIFGGT